MGRKTIVPPLASVLLTLLVLAMALAQPAVAATDGAVDTAKSAPEVQAVNAQVIRRLLAIQEALEDKRVRIRGLLEQLGSADEAEKARINEQIAELRETISTLTSSFENIVVSGASLRDPAEAGEQEMDWRNELILIARPLLNSLKGATAKPRKIEELRRTISQYEQQLEVSSKATESIDGFDQYEMPPAVASGLEKVAASWRERDADIRRALELSRFELSDLEAEEFDVFETLGKAGREFILGRGLTLLLALLTGVALWFAMHALRDQIKAWRGTGQKNDPTAKIRLVLYGYHLMTIVMVSLAVLSVFYVRGDLLLLSLSIIILITLALGAWRFLPGYIQEARLLLNVGAARAGERVIYNGLPFRIAVLNFYSELRNPELEGVIRLPLSALAQLTSRPPSHESWFPCQPGDYLLLPDGGFAQVVQQTVELVRLKVVGSEVQYRTADFLQLNIRNLTREGFGVIVVFGIDYQHQEIALDQVPERFRSGLQDAFGQAEFAQDLRDLSVDFKAANTNSLDYLVYATMEGGSAASYFKIGRLIQQTCVDICNHEGWIIPFTQLTIHQADEA